MVEPQVMENLLGGMHTLMSFVGAVGVLMSNTGLKELLESAFGSVDAERETFSAKC